jgi:hypothetical protein
MSESTKGKRLTLGGLNNSLASATTIDRGKGLIELF